MFLIKYMLSCILLTVVVSSAKLNETQVDTQLEQQEILKKDSIKLPVEIKEATVNVEIAKTDNIKLEGKLSNIETVNKEDKIVLTEQPTTERAVVTEINIITEKSSEEEESTISTKSLDAEKTTETETSTIQTTTVAVTEKEIKTRKTTLIEVTTEQILSSTNAGTLIHKIQMFKQQQKLMHFLIRYFSKTR